MTEYSTMYEYILKTIHMFIEDQEDVYKQDLLKMYGDGAWLFNFFTLNPRRLSMPEIQANIDAMFPDDNGGNPEQAPYNTALARVYGLYTVLYASGGAEFMNLVQKNTIAGLVRLNTTNQMNEKAVKKTLTALFQKHPVLLISIMGSSYYSKRLISARLRGLLKTQKK